ncbi:hypothetical protein GTV32_21620 [Gordonia sp. SID5947]|nr:hypothetical protein [Gordonia sp. SID5947]
MSTSLCSDGPPITDPRPRATRDLAIASDVVSPRRVVDVDDDRRAGGTSRRQDSRGDPTAGETVQLVDEHAVEPALQRIVGDRATVVEEQDRDPRSRARHTASRTGTESQAGARMPSRSRASTSRTRCTSVGVNSWSRETCSSSGRACWSSLPSWRSRSSAAAFVAASDAAYPSSRSRSVRMLPAIGRSITTNSDAKTITGYTHEVYPSPVANPGPRNPPHIDADTLIVTAPIHARPSRPRTASRARTTIPDTAAGRHCKVWKVPTGTDHQAVAVPMIITATTATPVRNGNGSPATRTRPTRSAANSTNATSRPSQFAGPRISRPEPMVTTT